MFCSYNEKKPLTTGFYKPVEANGMKLSDDLFVQIDLDMLDLISKIQKETDPDAYKAKWENKIGEKLFLYKLKGFGTLSLDSVNLDFISHCIGKREIADMRLADKDTLTRTAARKVADIFYHGEGDLNNPSIDAAIAMMLYIRNGYNKKDFWNNFKKELVLGLEKLLESNSPIQIEDQLLDNPFRFLYEEDTTIMNLMETVKDEVKYYKDDNFVIFDPEIAEIIKQTESYSDEEINHALGQYVIIAEGSDERGESKERILENSIPSLLYMRSIETSAFNAAMCISSILFSKSFSNSLVYGGISQGIVVYRKNGLSEADFWKNTCRQIIHLYEIDWL